MSDVNYTAFNGASNHKDIALDDNSHMSDVRTLLTSQGFMKDTDSFLYDNPVTGLKTVLQPRSAEATARLSACLWPAVPGEGFNNQIIQIVSVAESNPSFLGTTPQDGWLRNSSIFGVRAKLNPEFSDNNAGMFEPLMLQNVQSTNPNAPVSFTQCIIVQKGAIINLDISSWGALGFGYCITSAMGADIIPEEGLYQIYGNPSPNSPGAQSYASVSRYANGFKPNGDSIQIQSNQALGIAQQYDVEYSTLTFSSWSLSQGTFNGKTINCSTPIPSGVSALANAARAFDPTMEVAVMSADVGAGDGWQPGPPAGTTSVPSGGTQPGSPTAGPQSSQTYGAPMTNPYSPRTKPATRGGGLVGSMEVYFLVFTDKEAANNIIRVLNNPTMGV